MYCEIIWLPTTKVLIPLKGGLKRVPLKGALKRVPAGFPVYGARTLITYYAFLKQTKNICVSSLPILMLTSTAWPP